MPQNKYRQAMLFRGALLFAWLLVIFAFSQEPGAGDSWQAPVGYFLERKSAHIVEYCILAILSFRFFLLVFRSEAFVRVLLASALFALAYGATDELHQYFIPGRGAHILDVGIDGIGIFLGMAALLFVSRHSILKERDKKTA